MWSSTNLVQPVTVKRNHYGCSIESFAFDARKIVVIRHCCSGRQSENATLKIIVDLVKRIVFVFYKLIFKYSYLLVAVIHFKYFVRCFKIIIVVSTTTTKEGNTRKNFVLGEMIE